MIDVSRDSAVEPAPDADSLGGMRSFFWARRGPDRHPRRRLAENRAVSNAGLMERYHPFLFPLLLGPGKRLSSATDQDS
ncbi:hypothetical protein ACFXPM_02830 [Streptomyces sp. NPDC059095]|uniref:hypothetical protein n=1 Tax=Streptomyces sp. NPDC059095 TaxID=3346726 RepID=UPI0036CF9CBE